MHYFSCTVRAVPPVMFPQNDNTKHVQISMRSETYVQTTTPSHIQTGIDRWHFPMPKPMAREELETPSIWMGKMSSSVHRINPARMLLCLADRGRQPASSLFPKTSNFYYSNTNTVN